MHAEDLWMEIKWSVVSFITTQRKLQVHYTYYSLALVLLGE